MWLTFSINLFSLLLMFTGGGLIAFWFSYYLMNASFDIFQLVRLYLYGLHCCNILPPSYVMNTSTLSRLNWILCYICSGWKLSSSYWKVSLIDRRCLVLIFKVKLKFWILWKLYWLRSYNCKYLFCQLHGLHISSLCIRLTVLIFVLQSLLLLYA